jgi:hypothetical protein
MRMSMQVKERQSNFTAEDAEEKQERKSNYGLDNRPKNLAAVLA